MSDEIQELVERLRKIPGTDLRPADYIAIGEAANALERLRRIACEACGYPLSEALYASMEEYEQATNQQQTDGTQPLSQVQKERSG